MPTSILKPIEIPPFECGLWKRGWFIALLCLVFVAIDWELVPLKIFPFVFVFPLMLAAWNRSLTFALVCAVVLSLTRMAHQFVFADQSDSVDEVTAALVRFFVMVLLAGLTNLLGQQARQLRHRVKLLEGILPICSRCKSIRDEDNKWVQLEGYLSAHTAAQFSHGFCPQCFREYFGEEPPAAPGAK